MSLAVFQFYSETLKQNTAVNVIMPTCFLGGKSAEPAGKFRAVYLLHGITGDHSEWVRGTMIEFYALKYRVAAVIPDIGNSFGKNLPNGANYFDYLTGELPRIIESHFPLSAKREDMAIAGLSMGGYAAFRAAFNRPDVFGYAASLSGALEPMRALNGGNPFTKLAAPLTEFAFSGNYKEDEDDLLTALNNAKKSGWDIPKLYMAVGTDDFLYRENKAFYENAVKEGFEIKFEEGAGGHDMAFWNEYSERVLAWFTE